MSLKWRKSYNVTIYYQSANFLATVPSCPCTVQWLYGDHVGPSLGAHQQRKMYGKGTRRTVAVRWTCGTILRHRRSYQTSSTSRGWFNCCEASKDSFMLLSWWCPFKMKKGTWPTRQFKIIYRLVPLSTPFSCLWTVPLNVPILLETSWIEKYATQKKMGGVGKVWNFRSP